MIDIIGYHYVWLVIITVNAFGTQALKMAAGGGRPLFSTQIVVVVMKR